MTHHIPRRWSSPPAAGQEPTEQQTSYLETLPPAEWMPLDEVAQAWADFGAQTHEALGWQATSDAFAALAQEASAHRHYTPLLASLPVRRPSRPCWGYEEATSGLSEALARWQGALLALEEWSQQPTPDEDRPSAHVLVQVSRRHQWRVCCLLARLYQEREAAACAQGHAPLRLHLGHLSMVEEPERAEPEGERQL